MSKWWPFGQKKQEEQADAILSELFSKAVADSPETIPTYRRLENVTTVAERMTILLGISQQIENNKGVGWEILMPFVLGDTEHKIISTAAMNLAVLQPCPDGEALSGVNTICHFVDKVGYDSPRSASMLSGLLLLGDVQVFVFLHTAWEKLTPECRHIVASSWSGFSPRATVLMILDWLEKEENEAVYGALAGTLGRMALGAHEGKIVDIQRSFPAYAGEPLIILGVQDVRTFGRGIKSRLEALANKETGDRVMPIVLQAWLGDDDPEELIQDNSSPSARAAAFVEGKSKPDFTGERFVDSRPYWLQDDPLTSAAQMFMLQSMSKANETSSDYSTKVPWFSALRECVVLHVDRSSVELWCAYSLLAGLHKALMDGEDPPVNPDAAGIVTGISKMVTGELGVVASCTPWFLEKVFLKIHKELGVDTSKDGVEIAILSYSQRAFLLGQMLSITLASEEKDALMDELPRRRPSERLIFPIAHRTVNAATTAELAISPFLRFCQIKYASHPMELDFFACYFQEAEMLAGLSLDSDVSAWIEDASAYVESALKKKPTLKQRLLGEHQGEYGSLLKIFRMIDEAFEGETDDPVAVTMFYWNQILKREGFGEVAGPTRFDEIVVGVDFIAWWHLLHGNE
jgi:hypothetical protein